MSVQIKPTVGRVVLFHPGSPSVDPSFANTETCAAIIANVWSDACVNLAVFDMNGVAHSRTSVLLVQEGDPKPTSGYWCEWMPFQKGQAAKS